MAAAISSAVSTSNSTPPGMIGLSAKPRAIASHLARMAEVIFEILLNWPEISAEAVDKWIERRDKGLAHEKQH